MWLKCACDGTPYFSKVLFAVFWEQRCKGRLFRERAALIIVWLERVDLPLSQELVKPVLSFGRTAVLTLTQMIRVRNHQSYESVLTGQCRPYPMLTQMSIRGGSERLSELHIRFSFRCRLFLFTTTSPLSDMLVHTKVSEAENVYGFKAIKCAYEHAEVEEVAEESVVNLRFDFAPRISPASCASALLLSSRAHLELKSTVPHTPYHGYLARR